MRSDCRTEEVIRVQRIGHPVAQSLVDGRAQRAVASRDRNNLRSKQPHAADVGRLALHVNLAHVNGAWQSQPCARRRRRDTVLAGPRFGNDTLRAQFLGQQGLSHRVVDLVRARMSKILPLQPDLRSPAL